MSNRDTYTETYRDLCHGTDEVSAQSIICNGFEIRGSEDSWCGEGVYFYDIKSKAWWSAKRTCEKIKKERGMVLKPVVLCADIFDICVEDVFDMRSHRDLMDFERALEELFKSSGNYSIPGMSRDEEIIMLRAIYISYYAHKTVKKMVIGHFRQRPQPRFEHAIEFSNSLDMIFGIETIYCVKDVSIIKNVRQGGIHHDE